MMEVVHERCCGLDIHKKSVTACVITPEGKETRTFGAMTGELLRLADWMEAKGCTHVAMESTGVFWIAKHLFYYVGIVDHRHLYASLLSALREDILLNLANSSGYQFPGIIWHHCHVLGLLGLNRIPT
jgi:hypothetical protein